MSTSGSYKGPKWMSNWFENRCCFSESSEMRFVHYSLYFRMISLYISCAIHAICGIHAKHAMLTRCISVLCRATSPRSCPLLLVSSIEKGSAHCRRPRRIPEFSDLLILTKSQYFGFPSGIWGLGGFTSHTDSQLKPNPMRPFSICLQCCCLLP